MAAFPSKTQLLQLELHSLLILAEVNTFASLKVWRSVISCFMCFRLYNRVNCNISCKYRWFQGYNWNTCTWADVYKQENQEQPSVYKQVLISGDKLYMKYQVWFASWMNHKMHIVNDWSEAEELVFNKKKVQQPLSQSVKLELTLSCRISDFHVFNNLGILSLS